MRAVNLIPTDSRGRGRSRGQSIGTQIPAYVLLGFLAAAVALVTVYVLTGNSISSRTATLSSLKVQVAQEQATEGRLGEFTKFSQLAQSRIGTVHAIAAARFDWHTALSDLASVVPANTTLQSLNGTVVPGATAGGSTAGGTGSLRSDIMAPAFELAGCTDTQDDVSRLISQLRLINGVTRVALSNSQESTSSVSGNGVSGSSSGCGSGPTFDLVVFFQPVANAGASGVTSVATTGASGVTSVATTGASGVTSVATTGASGPTGAAAPAGRTP